ncbi:MAG: type II secretion system protein [Candidatus Yonathbacteria bacterium]|nr:type II secretion system protein [Candidatus Yonathbacteria bacterium]
MKPPRTSSSSRGFTILELLVVVAIIGILAALTMVLATQIRAKGRDDRRTQDMRQLQNALSLYYTNHNIFPISASPTILRGTNSVSTALLNDGVIGSLPADPLAPTYNYSYVSTNGSTYTMTFCMETNANTPYEQGCGNTVTP